MAETPASAPRPSLWAIASFLCSLAVLCPMASLLGPLLGARALVEIKTHPQRTGTRLAIAGIVIGVAATAFWAIAAVWWNATVRRPLIEGPRDQLIAGFAGDVAGFKAGFHGAGASEPDVEAVAFLSTLRDRYGAFLGSEQRPAGNPQAAPADRRRPRVHYVLFFEAGPLDAEAEFVVRDPAEGLVCRFGWLAVRDDTLGDLVYPNSAAVFADNETAPAEESSDAP